MRILVSSGVGTASAMAIGASFTLAIVTNIVAVSVAPLPSVTV